MQPLFVNKKNLARRIIAGIVISAMAIVISGCATPVGVSRVSEKAVYRQIDSSALTTNSYSSYTAVVLHRHGLHEEDFSDDPGEFVRNLHKIASHDDRRDLLLAMSELCFLAAQKAENAQKQELLDNREFFYSVSEPEILFPVQKPVNLREFYLGSAVYAYLFLLGPGNDPPPGSFDRRFRLACDLYNRSIAQLIIFNEGKIALHDKVLPLPTGKIHLKLKTLEMPWDTTELDAVFPADAFQIHGLSVRNRMPGMGAPILAVRKKSPGRPVSAAVPATIFMEIKGGLNDIGKGDCIGEVSIYSTMSESNVMVNGQKVPLETDLTAPIAYTFNDPILWSLGLNLFRMGQSLFKPGIYTIQPYKPGLIPLVLVHGTMSSPVWWAEMLNTLRNDPQIRKHFQIWLYLYDSGKPVVFSALHLRETIESKIKKWDPEGKDPALKNIVVLGHSQGGLLARYTAVETGDALVKAVLGKPLNELDLSPKEKEMVNRYIVVHPLPEVRRVIFISTPHRGSILAGNFARRMAAKFIALPSDFIQVGTDLMNITEKFSRAGRLKWSMAKTSIDSMASDNPGLLAMAELGFPPGVKGHSIIAIKGDEKPPEGDDGVVAYKSAHIKGVESELVVPYGHSCQMEPVVIEEVRRILIEHLKDADDANITLNR
jgi:pimeloyl-ACP methyl ester carboxylesterase